MTDVPMLEPRDHVPHITVQTTAGDVFTYTSIWQHKNLALVALPAGSGEEYPAALAARAAEFDALDSVCIATRDQLPGLPAPGLIIADRYGEIVHVERGDAALLDATELLAWLDYVERRCPECEGESR